MKDIMELAESKLEIQQIKRDVLADLSDIEDRALEAKEELEDFLSFVQKIADSLDEEKREFTRAMFDRFLEAGINVGAELRIDLSGVTRPQPFKIVGICSRGFVYADAEGKEGILGPGALQILDKIIVNNK